LQPLLILRLTPMENSYSYKKMIDRRRAGVACAATVILIVAAAWVVSQQTESPHVRNGECASCHLNEPTAATTNGETLVFVNDAATICRRCHEIDPKMSHPVNVLATKPPPDAFPLDWASRITCTTCHYFHRKDKKNLTGYMLRAEKTGRALCTQCHEDLLAMATDKHQGVLNKSHFGIDSDSAARGILDKTSLQCLACHDGTMASAQSVGGSKTGGSWQHSSGGMSHPIGVDFPPKTKRRTRYRPRAMVDARIRLFDGKLGCCSCHEPFSDKKHGLVMSNDRSALCLECHEM
jgi:predicted CXXCH cytochrome family protein